MGTTKFNVMENLIKVLDAIDKDLENTRMAIIDCLGGDPGNDIGDADSGMELLNNIITEPEEEEDARERITAVAEAMGFTFEEVFKALLKLENLNQEEWNALHEKRYPGRIPYSGFGFTKE